MSEVKILHLDTVNADEQSEKYGVNFQKLPSSVYEELHEFIVTMTDTRDTVCEQIGVEVPESRAILFLPEIVLSEPLTDSQVIDINNHETDEVAAFSTAIQRRLLGVPIVESYEDLKYLPIVFERKGINASFSSKPFHEACGFWAGRDRLFWARSSFTDRLAVFGKLLNSAEVSLQFEDAFRPLGVQEGLFKRRVNWTKTDHPDWTEDRVVQEARSKTAAIARLASHKGGAAVDASIKDLNGKNLTFGHDYPDGGALVFPRTPYVTAEQWRNRQLFQVAAGLSGLTLYVGEDWHVSYGDNLASLDVNGEVDPNYVAIYGPIKSFEARDETGYISGVYSEDEMDEVFPME
jgi:D-alanyl-D-alanine dipeptidase